jgi:guanylate kinase
MDLFNRRETVPLLFVISGHSGAGKDTVIHRMRERNFPIQFVITATTRKPRENEQDGIDYFFFSHDEFARMIENDELIEYAVVYQDYKGVPRNQVDNALRSGKDVVLRVDVQGAATIQKLYPNSILIYLTAKDEGEFIQRLIDRKTETPEGLNLRIAMARKEMKEIKYFDYLVVNQNSKLDKTVDIIQSIIEAEHHRIRMTEVNE